jgi:hypothetical protein
MSDSSTIILILILGLVVAYYISPEFKEFVNNFTSKLSSQKVSPITEAPVYRPLTNNDFSQTITLKSDTVDKCLTSSKDSNTVLSASGDCSYTNWQTWGVYKDKDDLYLRNSETKKCIQANTSDNKLSMVECDSPNPKIAWNPVKTGDSLTLHSKASPNRCLSTYTPTDPAGFEHISCQDANNIKFKLSHITPYNSWNVWYNDFSPLTERNTSKPN